MQVGNNFVGKSMKQRLANTKGKFSTQFMSENLQQENPSKKKALEDGLKMGGYEVNVRKPKTARTDTQQPMAGYSEFWIG